VHGHGAEPLAARVRDLGAMPSLGIDTIPIVTDDMFSEMRGALVLIRYREHQRNRAAGNPSLTAIPVKSREALEWATVGGARALRLDDRIGTIAPGKKADLVMLGAHDLNLFPVHDPVYSVAEQAGAANVKDVMVGGEFRKRDGALLFPADRLRRLQAELAASAARIMAESGYRVAAAE
jgi:cytosine/adenosine deaminase-related metal-dependent hydrolase